MNSPFTGLVNMPPNLISILKSLHRIQVRRAKREAHVDGRYALLPLSGSHFPHGGREPLHADISPLDTFRLVLNYYFVADLKLLLDRGHSAPREHPFMGVDMTEAF